MRFVSKSSVKVIELILHYFAKIKFFIFYESS